MGEDLEQKVLNLPERKNLAKVDLKDKGLDFYVEHWWETYSDRVGDDYPIVIGFNVWEICGREADGSLQLTAPMGGPAISQEEAQLFLHGHVKWDGCSNWFLAIAETIMLHFCSVKQAEDIGRLFRALYEIAANEMPTNEFDDELKNNG